ncbi:LuxR C-terminal-related transcriptional regulator [Actinomadura rupiterrae]|uniref:LuxR C-terminal-related transcriptional regulator n=1 Tax=Actinomadura rupiterrae TaxID=559627 RepID=UPI0020A4F707|nr:LuxR C-terminal-related transcriptional regulator [Actinomadura rupiterrae]MCP2343579.1 DNA-binding CsgD family transcriptional regulator [Actinomadura rupiterrae]
MGVAGSPGEPSALAGTERPGLPPAADIVVIEGAAGMGKTSLLHQFGRRMAGGGAAFLSAAGASAERDLPLSTVGQLFSLPALTPDEVARAERLLRDGALIAATLSAMQGPTGLPTSVPLPTAARPAPSPDTPGTPSPHTHGTPPLDTADFPPLDAVGLPSPSATDRTTSAAHNAPPWDGNNPPFAPRPDLPSPAGNLPPLASCDLRFADEGVPPFAGEGVQPDARGSDLRYADGSDLTFPGAGNLPFPAGGSGFGFADRSDLRISDGSVPPRAAGNGTVPSGGGHGLNPSGGSGFPPLDMWDLPVPGSDGLPPLAGGGLEGSGVDGLLSWELSDVPPQAGGGVPRLGLDGFPPDGTVGTDASVPTPVFNQLADILLGLAERTRVVIGVDDVHHADAASLQFLLHLARRPEAAGLLLVLTGYPPSGPARRAPHTELLYSARTRRLRLGPLPKGRVTALLAEYYDAPTARGLADEVRRATGGNPRLVRALAEDGRAAGRPDGPVFGDAFRHAVLACLHRSGTTGPAEALAVLPTGTPAELHGELTGLDGESIRLAHDLLRRTGLVEGDRFRHPAITRAVLSGLGSRAGTALYLRAADLLHHDGAPAEAVADRLVAADRAPAAWSVAALREAAGQALAEGRAPDAVDRLRLALRECTDDRTPLVRFELARAEWQIDPATAARHLADLGRDARAGLLPAEAVVTLVTWMLWLGRAEEVLDVLVEASGASREGSADRLHVPDSWLRYAYPGLARHPAATAHTQATPPPPNTPTPHNASAAHAVPPAHDAPAPQDESATRNAHPPRDTPPAHDAPVARDAALTHDAPARDVVAPSAASIAQVSPDHGPATQEAPAAHGASAARDASPAHGAPAAQDESAARNAASARDASAAHGTTVDQDASLAHAATATQEAPAAHGVPPAYGASAAQGAHAHASAGRVASPAHSAFAAQDESTVRDGHPARDAAAAHGTSPARDGGAAREAGVGDGCGREGWGGEGGDGGFGARERIVAAVEETLRHAGLGFGHLTRIAVIAALIHAGEPDEAERWCDALDREEGRRPPLADALVLVLRALIHIRRGEPDAAARCAGGAFDLLPARGFGIFVGIPLAVAAEAFTVTGRFAEADAVLRRPLPEALFASPLVLPYLRARGRYRLATGRPRAALTEFMACRDLMASSGLDLPCVVPWRTDLAEAYLALGDSGTAHRLAMEQLELLPPGETRTRGATLRVLALALPPDRRIWPLAEAVELLERSPDRLELARALADLADHHRRAGRRAAATALARRARALADDCGVVLTGTAADPDAAVFREPATLPDGPAPRADAPGFIASAAFPDGAPTGTAAFAPGGPASATDPLTALSEAERRVATLAAGGFTNRQIAHRLHVTASTVEQHLTRIYRKLKIRRRTDLPRVSTDRPGAPAEA